MSYTMEPWEISATIDAEAADRHRQLQNGGSDLEPLERVSEIQVFREVCAGYYRRHEEGPCDIARLQFYAAMTDRFGKERVWQMPRIKAVLDATEARVRTAAPPGHGCSLCASHAAGDPTVGRRYDDGKRWVHSVVYGGGATGLQRPCLAPLAQAKEAT